MAINPFAKKRAAQEERLAEESIDRAVEAEVMEGHGLNFVAAMQAALNTVSRPLNGRQGTKSAWSYTERNKSPRSAWMKLSIRQRTRLNRDRRNRERHYAKYASKMAF